MPRTSELTNRITELLERRDELSGDELEEIVMYESDERITPLDNFNIGLVFHGLSRYMDSLRCLGDALDAYETPGEENMRTFTLAYVGECMKQIGNDLVREGDEDGAIEFYNQSTKVYAEVMKDINSIRIQFVPTILANAATTFYNTENYVWAAKVCETYYVSMNIMKAYVTPETNHSIDTVFKKVMEKITPARKG